MPRTVFSWVLDVSKAGDSATSLGSLCKHLTAPFWCLAIDPMGLCCSFCYAREGEAAGRAKRCCCLCPVGIAQSPSSLCTLTWHSACRQMRSPHPKWLLLVHSKLCRKLELKCVPRPHEHETCKRVARIQLRVPSAAGLTAASLHWCPANTSVLGRGSVRLTGLAGAPF